MTDYFVRPAGGGPYGNGSGVDYDNAYDGFANVPAGIQIAGNTLIVAGQHAEQLNILGSGDATDHFVVTGDYLPDPGSIIVTGDEAIAIEFREYVTARNMTAYGDTNYSVKVQGSNNIVLQSLIIAGAGLDAVELRGTCSDVRLDTIAISDPPRHGILLNELTGETFTDIVIENVSINNAGSDGIAWNVAATHLSTIVRLTINGCTITNAGGNGIELYIEDTADAGASITDLVVTNNKVTDSGQNGVLVYSSLPSPVANNTDCVISGNTFTGNGNGVSGGGLVLYSFGSSTNDYGKVEIANNNMSNNDGVHGGMGIYTCEYARIYNNKLNDNQASTASVDGSGLDIDGQNQYMRVYNNEISRNLGAGTGADGGTHGAAIAINGVNADIDIWNCVGTGNRCGFFISTASKTNINISHCAFSKSFRYGIDNLADRDGTVDIRNCIFTGDGSTGTIGIYDRGTTGNTLDEDFSVLHDFVAQTSNHTLGVNSRDTEPSLDAGQRPHNRSLVASGVKLPAVPVDFNGVAYQPDPTIGAFEMFRRLMVVAAARGGQTIRRPQR